MTQCLQKMRKSGLKICKKMAFFAGARRVNRQNGRFRVMYKGGIIHPLVVIPIIYHSK